MNYKIPKIKSLFKTGNNKTLNNPIQYPKQDNSSHSIINSTIFSIFIFFIITSIIFATTSLIISSISFPVFSITPSLTSVSTTPYSENTNNKSNNKVIVDFYYMPTCPHCHNVLRSGILDNLKNISIIHKIIANSNFVKLTSALNIEAAVPTAIVYSTQEKTELDKIINKTNNKNQIKTLKSKIIILQGDENIIKNLKTAINTIRQNIKENIKETNNNKKTTKQITKETTKQKSVWSSFILVLITALSDSINPCIMSVLILLISYLLSLKKRDEVIKYGSLFILIVYLTYFIIGLLLIYGINILSVAFHLNYLSKYFIILVALLCVFAGIVNIKDYFAYGKGLSFSLKNKDKLFVKRLLRNISFASILLLSIFITVVEFPCSGIMYVGIVGYLMSLFSIKYVILYLIFYNIIFVLPLIIIVFLSLKANNVKIIDSFRIEHRRLFRLIMGIVLIGLSILLFIIYF